METARVYARLKARHPSLVAVKEEVLKKIETEWIAYENAEDTAIWIKITIAVAAVWASLPFLLVFFVRKAIALEPHFNLSVAEKQYLFSHWEIGATILVLMWFTFLYTVVAPSATIRKLLRVRPHHRSADAPKSESIYRNSVFAHEQVGPRLHWNSRQFMAFTFSSWYLIAVFILLYVRAYEWLSPAISRILVIVLLMIPGIALAALPGLFVGFALSVLNIKLARTGKRESMPSVCIILLMRLMDQLDSKASLDAANLAVKEDISGVLSRVAYFIRHMYADAHGNDARWRYTKSRAADASHALLSLAADVLYPAPKTLSLLRLRLLSYLNTFLSGNYENLPTVPVSAGYAKEQNAAKRSGLMFMVGILIYMAIPIAVMVGAHLLTGYVIDPDLYPLLSILYVIWAAWGLLFSSDRLSVDTRSFSIDLLKSVTPWK